MFKFGDAIWQRTLQSLKDILIFNYFNRSWIKLSLWAYFIMLFIFSSACCLSFIFFINVLSFNLFSSWANLAFSFCSLLIFVLKLILGWFSVYKKLGNSNLEYLAHVYWYCNALCVCKIYFWGSCDLYSLKCCANSFI